MRHGLQHKAHGMQCVARGKAVTIERRHGQIDPGMAYEWSLAHQRGLETAVDQMPAQSGGGHNKRHPERDPERSVAKPAGGTHDLQEPGPCGGTVEAATQAVFRTIEPSK